jgi:hypothetical protein
MKSLLSIRWKDAIIALLATLVLQVPVEAQRLAPSPHETHALALMRGSGERGASRFTKIRTSQRIRPLSVTDQVTVAGSVTSSAQMKLPPSSFPDDFAQLQSQPLTAADADGKIYSQLHTTSYTDLGMMGGWWDYYSKQIPDGLFDITYLGSYYRDRDAAQSAFDDVASNLSFVGPITTCSLGERCLETTATITFSDGTYRGIFRVVQASNALAETASVVPAADVGTYLDTIRSNLDRLSASFLGIFPQAQPTATAVPPTSTPVPTAIPPTPTATAVPTPTAAPTSVPTATPARTAKKPTQCKKGYRLVHGKCKKKGH